MASRRNQVTYSERPNHRARMAHAKGEREFRTYDTSALRPKKSKGPYIFMAIVILVVLGLLIFGILTFSNSCSASGNAALLEEGQQVSVVVEEGSGASAIASTLQNAGLISSTAEFTKRVTELGAQSSLLPGTYQIEGGTSIDDIIVLLQTGPGMTGSALTIPEGYTLAAVATRVEEVTGGRITAAEFSAKAADASVYASEFSFLSEAVTHSLEGFLFPKTYDIQADDTADDIIKMMLSQYQQETASLDYSYPQSQGLNEYETLILASIVEKESSSDAEVRAKVAAVFYNRLSNTGAPTYGLLGSDATTAYELGEEPTNYDWSTDSPYNTRVNAGLPPTPICAPSIESLEAVCSPASDFADYYFFSFWSNDAGGVDYYFDKTYEEHQATIAAHS